MKDIAFGQYLENARAHLKRLYARTGLSPAKQNKLLDEILQELSTALEELQAANEELRDQGERLVFAQRRYEASFHGAPDAHLVTDRFATISQANHAAAVLLNYPMAQLERKPLIVFLSPDSQPTFLDQLRYIQESVPNHEFQYRVQPHSAPSFPAALTVSAVKDADTGQVSLHWLLRDVSERWQAEKRMRDLAHLTIVLQEQDRKEISKVLCADIGQVLLALDMNVEAISKTLSPEMASIGPSLKSISGQLKEIVVGIELLARRLYPPVLDLLGLEPALKSYCESFARQRHLSVEFTGVPVESLPDSKRILLYRLLQVALDRAVELDDPHYIRVAMDADEHQIRLSIEDHAVSFDGHPHDATAFLPDTSAGRGGQESGGLVEISDRLELLGGSLEVRTQPGAGTRVIARLPCERLRKGPPNTLTLE